MQLQSGRVYYAVPMNYLHNEGGDVRPVYAIICGEAGPNNRLAVPQNQTVTIAGQSPPSRPVYGTAGCVDGGLTAGTVVVAIPQGYEHDEGGDKRPVYAYVCCPPGSSSSSSSSGMVCAVCPGVGLPNTLHATITSPTSGTDCPTIHGTFSITSVVTNCEWVTLALNALCGSNVELIFNGTVSPPLLSLGTSTPQTPTSGQCSPFSFLFENVPAGDCLPCSVGLGGFVNILITL